MTGASLHTSAPPEGQPGDGADPADPVLDALVAEVMACPDLDDRALDRLLRRHPKDGRGFYRKREILAAVRNARGRPEADDPVLAARLRTCPTRSLSGVLPVTVLTRPYPCPGRCVFCPSDVRMPKSYLRAEPGCQRAEANAFDPYLQTWARVDAYRAMGHPTDKVELIVLGGTWSHYPGPYQRWFVLRALEALDDFGRGRDRRSEARSLSGVLPAPAPLDGRSVSPGDYDRVIAGSRRPEQAAGETASWETLARAQRANESAPCRLVGLSLETRPDRIDDSEVVRLRRLGATKVQLGVQSLDAGVLHASRRGHGRRETFAAIRRLRAAGFKVHAHWMANLPGADPAGDRRDFARLFSDPRVRPDELKLYPTSLVETAELVRWHDEGRWKPYSRETLVALVADALASVPTWCRVTRVIRDIPSPDILVGSRETNLREAAERLLAERGVALREIRACEVRGTAFDPQSLRMTAERYTTSVGTEHFLGASTPAGRLAGFVRLSLPRPDARPPAGLRDELEGAAVLREVHVYGQATALGQRHPGRPQHAGLGARLVARAATVAREQGYRRLSVISALGTRPWYRTLGFEDGPLYQHRDTRG